LQSLRDGGWIGEDGRTDDGGKVIKVVLSFTIPEWLVRAFIEPLLLYRRIRYGYRFRRIPLTQGKYAIVDPEDYQRINKYRWYPVKGHNTVYAIRLDKWVKGRKRKSYFMHRQIMRVPDGMVCDHINGNGLDNRKANLRPGTYAQNSWNRAKTKVKSYSKYKGVSMRKKDRKWEAQICVNGKRIHLGRFKNQIEAAKAYDAAAKKYHGVFAVLNFLEFATENTEKKMP